MTDDIEITVRVPLTDEQMEVLKDPHAKTFVEQEISRALARDWEDRCLRTFFLINNIV